MSRRRSVDEDDVSDVSSEASSQGSKRRRLNDNEPSSDDLLPDSFRRSPRANRTMRLEDEEHQPGSIVRITVKNFVTYTKATFKCGPSLNMIIGPNGTGKSTLVCAICLGLGSKPAVLGRSKEIGEYVKNGHTEADIEVELQGKVGQPNVVIHHNIKRAGNKSAWRINGRQTTAKDVAQTVRSFSIQIDNLCQFLPQDRVVEFAQMTPVDLLVSTQKAAAREQMTAWHVQLKQLGQDRLAMQSGNNEDLAALAALERRHAAQQGEVDRIRERKHLTMRLEGLQMAKPSVQYVAARARLSELKQERDQRKAELRILRGRVEPTLRVVEAKDQHVTQLKDSIKEGSEIIKRFDAQIDKKRQAVDKKKDDIAETEKNIDREVKDYNKRKPELQRIDQQIRNLKHQQEQDPVVFVAKDWNDKIREKDAAIREIQEEAGGIKEKEADVKSQVIDLKARWDRAKADLANLQSAAGQQTAALTRASSDSARAYQWLQQNPDHFTDKIYGPPLIECKVKDSRYANALEACVGRNDMLCFTATNREDWRKFLHVCQTVLKVKDIRSKVAGHPLSHFQAPMPKEQLAGYGLQDYALDFLEGPEPVLAMLCDSVRLHRTGISLRDISDAQYERLTDSPIQSWVAGSNSYRINRRKEYGPTALSAVVTEVKDAMHWGRSGGIDQEAQRELKRTIMSLERDLGSLDDEREPIEEQLKSLGQKTRTLNDEKDALSQEKAALQKAWVDYQRLPDKIRTLEEKKKSTQELQDAVHTTLEGLRENKQRLMLERAQLAIDNATLLERSMQMQEELAELEIQQIEAEAELEHVEKKSEEVRRMLALREHEITELEGEIKAALELGKKLAKVVQENANKLDQDGDGEEMRKSFDRWIKNQDLETGDDLGDDEARTIDDLDAEIITTRGRLELLSEGNPRALEQFEARARQIEQMKDKIANFEATLSLKNQQIAKIRQEWEPELDQLIEQISAAFAHNFERIGCAGQVSVHKVENDFREWAIQIEVKFRENEELAILDSHRQSGGERAVSTVFYLMALQSMARSPFRVVDEINQGMDPRNERMVHERMVDIACSENTSQYFLVTPKLLNGLKYHERMVVHIIYSGSDMPNGDDGEEGKLDFGKLAQRARQMGRVH